MISIHRVLHMELHHSIRALARGVASAVLIGALAGCAAPTPAPTPTALPSPTAAPTSTPAPTETAIPSPTAAPSPTAVPSGAPEASGAPEVCQAAGGCAIFRGSAAVLIGVAGPMSGDNSYFGIDEFNSARLAVQDAGPVDGHPIQAVQGDDLGTEEGGRTVGQMFAGEPSVVAVMGHAFSAPSAAAMPFYAEKLIPMMSGSATRASLTQQGSPVFNRLVSGDRAQALAAATFLINHLKAKSIAVIYDSTDYGKFLAQNVREYLTRGGATVAAFEPLETGKTDYSDVLRKVAALKPGAVYFAGYQPEAAVLARQKASAGLNVPFMSGDGVFGEHFLELAGDASEGYYATVAGAPFSPERKAFGDAYLAAYGIDAGTTSGYSWFYYDATQVLIEAIRQVAVSQDGTLYIPRQALVEAVRHTQGYQGLVGEVTCDGAGECAHTPTFVVYQVQQGRLVQLPPDPRP